MVNRIDEREELLTKIDPIVHITDAEDGFRLCVELSRSNQILQTDFYSSTDLMDRGISRKDADLLENYSLKMREIANAYNIRSTIFQVHTPDSKTKSCFVSKSNAGDLLSPSLLSKLLTIPEGLLASGEQEGGADDVGTQQTAASIRQPGTAVEKVSKRTDKHLALATDDESTYIVEKKGTESYPEYHVIRELIPECVDGFKNLTISRHDTFNETQDFSSLSDFNGFMMQALKKVRDEKEGVPFSGSRYYLHIDRKDLISVIISIAQQVHNDFHVYGKVHGDIKPQNILISSKGAVVIDDLKLKSGEISLMATAGWAAPEQFITNPVSASTDVYPLGLMLLSAIDGQLTGEIMHYLLASSKREKREVNFVKNPYIYINPADAFLFGDGLLEWIKFVEKCLRFNPYERFETAGEFARELNNLIRSKPLLGSRSCGFFDRGENRILNNSSNRFEVCHVIRDNASGWGRSA